MLTLCSCVHWLCAHRNVVCQLYTIYNFKMKYDEQDFLLEPTKSRFHISYNVHIEFQGHW
jgi:hypothetical protein